MSTLVVPVDMDVADALSVTVGGLLPRCACVTPAINPAASATATIKPLRQPLERCVSCFVNLVSPCITGLQTMWSMLLERSSFSFPGISHCDPLQRWGRNLPVCPHYSLAII
ncbi:MAG: hypothetical protein ABI624_03165 [Casimicrobiaceae bacterium]